MKRKHLLELHEQPWMPSLLRDAATGYLEVLSRLLGLHRHLAPVVRETLERSGARRIVDLCSGGGGPMPWIHRELGELGGQVDLLLTDLFPNREAFACRENCDGIQVRMEPVDARAVPEDLTGMRTMANAFHHFRPEEARQILADAAQKSAPLLVMEITDRSWHTVLTSPLIFLLALIFMPMVRPLRIGYLVFTYLIPLVPAILFIDGLVSHLRSYRVDELRAMAESVAVEGYRWEVRRLPLQPGLSATLLCGMPENPESSGGSAAG
ncbi:hypothetical protein ABI59_15430 [Acidobacteria bacterium Mor1]|nr:hypothetical protein ABI59_15430 [Acidobacteria bacterium Mor1]